MSIARILIVEDEGIIALDIQQILASLGYQVVDVVPTGEEAVERAKALSPDLVLMDIQLAGRMDGIEAATEIRLRTNTPVIYLTAYADQAILNRAKVAQPFGYLTKPLEKRDLHTAIEISLYRHAVERRASRHAYRFQQIVNSVEQGLVLVDDQQVIEVANGRGIDYVRLLNDDPDLQVGSVLDALAKHPLEDFLAGGNDSVLHEIVIHHADDRVFEIKVIGLVSEAVPSKQGEDRGYVISLVDVTRVRQQEKAHQMQERLATVGQLAAGVAHDFGNILSAIALSAQIVPQLESDLSDRSQQHLQIIRDQVRRAHDLITQILDFSRKADYERVLIDLAPLYKEWISLFRQTIPEDIQLRFHVPPSPCTVLAEPTRMQQVLLNLLINARDAMPGGGKLVIDLGVVRPGQEDAFAQAYDLGDSAWVRIRVSDTGDGIAPEVLPHIFDPFFTTKPSGKGFGLGLSQVHGIIEQHGGHVFAESRPGKGTTFFVLLPCANDTPVEVTTDRMDGPLVAGTRQTLLVVEDDPLIRHALSESIGMMGYHVLEASDGREALSWLRLPNSRIAMVISDMIMPHMGAVHLCRTMQSESLEMPVVVVSGYPLEAEFEALRELGIQHILTKPLRLDQLSRVIADELHLVAEGDMGSSH